MKYHAANVERETNNRNVPRHKYFEKRMEYLAINIQDDQNVTKFIPITPQWLPSPERRVVIDQPQSTCAGWIPNSASKSTD